MTEVYTASTVVDIVDALPTLFGFTPDESFIGITTNGARRRFGFRLRLDMPEFGEIEQAGRVIAEHLNAHAGDGVILVALSADHQSADALTNAVLDQIDPVEIVAVLRADTHHVWEYDSAGLIDEDDPGLVRGTSATSDVIVQAVAAGQQVWGSRGELAAQFAPAGWSVEVTATAAATTVTSAVEVVDRHHTGSGILSEGDILLLATVAKSIAGRDQMWARIDRANAEAHAETWRMVATHTATIDAAGPYALAAFGYWLTGDGARASICVDQALAATPDYSMAEMLATILNAGIDPATWTGFGI